MSYVHGVLSMSVLGVELCCDDLHSVYGLCVFFCLISCNKQHLSPRHISSMGQ